MACLVVVHVHDAATIEDREERKITAVFTLNRMDFEVGSPYSMINPLSIEEEIPMKVTAFIPPGAKSEAP